MLKEYTRRVEFRGYPKLIFTNPLVCITKITEYLHIRPDNVYSLITSQSDQ